ncbi:MAG: sulfite exporter TauE/SafE family protein [Candidatus Omnitrophica bacterium]|nr:sulfite exporter TauE/SafE family protein [Candidatus Omnitrophota bacterium]
MSSVILLILICIVAAVYASVGHGGASGYLAVLALAGYAPAQMSTSALLLNLLVAGTACVTFWRAGHGSWRLLWPFLATSVPCALIGGWLDVPSHAYQWLFAVVLLFAAVRLCLPVLPAAQAIASSEPRCSAALPIGAGIGLISGIVGIGGGIFLSPLLVLCRWASPKQTAAASACFIVVNSAAGLAGRLAAGRVELGWLLPLVGVAFVGGWLGSRFGAGYVSNPALCRILAGVLAVAAMKGLMT